MHCKNLMGHSGCQVTLIEDGNSLFVRKISGTHSYNSRLRLQAEKQNNFSCEYVYVPKIYNMDYTHEGLFYFDMEYIRGITLAEYMKSIQVCSIKNIVTTIIHSFNIRSEKNSSQPQKAFTKKIHSLEKTLCTSEITILNKAFKMLSKHRWDKFSLSPCHGDMTLENIIVKNDKLYLIDFLDSFYDCWIMDAATLMQDVLTMWSYRHERQDINTVIRLMIFRDIMTDIVDNIAGTSFMLEIYYALLLKLIRIYPYTKDKITLDFLSRKIATVMKLITHYDEDTNNSLCWQ